MDETDQGLCRKVLLGIVVGGKQAVGCGQMWGLTVRFLGPADVREITDVHGGRDQKGWA